MTDETRDDGETRDGEIVLGLPGDLEYTEARERADKVMRSSFDCTPQQYHHGLDLLWDALGVEGVQDKTAFELAAERIKTLERAAKRDAGFVTGAADLEELKRLVDTVLPVFPDDVRASSVWIEIASRVPALIAEVERKDADIFYLKQALSSIRYRCKHGTDMSDPNWPDALAEIATDVLGNGAERVKSQEQEIERLRGLVGNLAILLRRIIRPIRILNTRSAVNIADRAQAYLKENGLWNGSILRNESDEAYREGQRITREAMTEIQREPDNA